MFLRISHAVKWRNNSHSCFEFSIFDVQKQERTFRIKPKLAKLSYLLVLIYVLHQSRKVRQEIKSLGSFFSCQTFSNNVTRGHQNDAVPIPIVLLDFCPKMIFVSNFFPAMRCPIVRMLQTNTTIIKLDKSLTVKGCICA